MPLILATQQVEIKRMMVQSQPGQRVRKTLPQNNPSQKRAGGAAQGVGPVFKPEYCKKKRKEKKDIKSKKMM
jgi:hypothetical protein